MMAGSARASSPDWSSTGFAGPIRRVSSLNSFVPLGTAAQHVLLGEDDIEKAAHQVAGMDRR